MTDTQIKLVTYKHKVVKDFYLRTPDEKRYDIQLNSEDIPKEFKSEYRFFKSGDDFFDYVSTDFKKHPSTRALIKLKYIEPQEKKKKVFSKQGIRRLFTRKILKR